MIHRSNARSHGEQNLLRTLDFIAAARKAQRSKAPFEEELECAVHQLAQERLAYSNEIKAVQSNETKLLVTNGAWWVSLIAYVVIQHPISLWCLLAAWWTWAQVSSTVEESQAAYKRRLETMKTSIRAENDARLEAIEAGNEDCL